MNAQKALPEARLLGFLNAANKGDLEGGRLAEERGDSMAVKTHGLGGVSPSVFPGFCYDILKLDLRRGAAY